MPDGANTLTKMCIRDRVMVACCPLRRPSFWVTRQLCEWENPACPAVSK